MGAHLLRARYWSMVNHTLTPDAWGLSTPLTKYMEGNRLQEDYEEIIDMKSSIEDYERIGRSYYFSDKKEESQSYLRFRSMTVDDV